MEKVIVGFSKARSKKAIISKLIQLVERTSFSHVYIKIFSPKLNRNLIYQATAAGIYFCGEESFLEHSTPVQEYPFSISDEDKTKLLQWAIDNSGKSYASLQIIGLLLIRILSRLNIKISNPFKNKDKSYICCELAWRALKTLGFKLKDEDEDNIGLREMEEQIKDLVK